MRLTLLFKGVNHPSLNITTTVGYNSGLMTVVALTNLKSFLQKFPKTNNVQVFSKQRFVTCRRMLRIPAICKGLAGCNGLNGSPAPIVARSTTSWSALQKSPSSRRANSSPGMSCRLHATHLKHSI